MVLKFLNIKSLFLILKSPVATLLGMKAKTQNCVRSNAFISQRGKEGQKQEIKEKEKNAGMERV